MIAMDVHPPLAPSLICKLAKLTFCLVFIKCKLKANSSICALTLQNCRSYGYYSLQPLLFSTSKQQYKAEKNSINFSGFEKRQKQTWSARNKYQLINCEGKKTTEQTKSEGGTLGLVTKFTTSLLLIFSLFFPCHFKWHQSHCYSFRSSGSLRSDVQKRSYIISNMIKQDVLMAGVED